MLTAAVAAASADVIMPKQLLLENINALRLEKGLYVCRNDRLMEETAQAYAEELSFLGVLSHEDARGNRAVGRLRERGSTAAFAGEILGFGGSLEDILKSWLQSPGHRKVVLFRNWSHAGIGISEYKQKLCVVVLFRVKPFTDIRVEKTQTGTAVTLSIDEAETGVPVVFSGSAAVKKIGGRMFLIEDESGGPFLRLGIQRGESAIITDSLMAAP